MPGGSRELGSSGAWGRSRGQPPSTCRGGRSILTEIEQKRGRCGAFRTPPFPGANAGEDQGNVPGGPGKNAVAKAPTVAQLMCLACGCRLRCTHRSHCTWVPTGLFPPWRGALSSGGVGVGGCPAKRNCQGGRNAGGAPA